MKEAKISDIKNQLSRYLSLVRSGETIRILDRDRPIAHIVPITERAGGTEPLAEMERKGLIRRGSGRIDPEIVRHDPPGPEAGALGALLDERESR